MSNATPTRRQAGCVTPDGIQHGFTGWLGLMRVLEDHIRSDRHHAAKPTPQEDA
jgi:hypothetical protein